MVDGCPPSFFLDLVELGCIYLTSINGVMLPPSF